MGCLPSAPKINPPAATPPPAAQGADALAVGPATAPASRGAVGRLALRVGSAANKGA
jgi:hypothetical protein